MGNPVPDGPVEIAAFEAAPQAYHLKGYLESRGIRAFVADELTGGWMGLYNRSIGGIRVMVAPQDLERAQVELETFEASMRPHPGEGAVEAAEEDENADADAEEEFEAEVEESDADEPLPAPSMAEREVEASSGHAEPGATDDPTGEAFAKRTRVFAVIGVAAPVFAPIALSRVPRRRAGRSPCTRPGSCEPEPTR